MNLITELLEALRGDPDPVLIDTISDRASLTQERDCYLELLKSDGWTDEQLTDAVRKHVAAIHREMHMS